MKPIAADLRDWRDQASQAAPDAEAGADFEQIDRAAMDEIRARQAANRNLAYLRYRPSRYADASYAKLRPEQDPKGMVSRWLTAGPRGLVIAGPSRTGKTTAAYAIANDAHQSGIWVMTRTATGLSAALKPDSGEPLAYNYATTCPLLLLDDLGRERVTDWWLEQLHRIVDERCSNQLRLIVTANTAAVAPDAYAELVERYGDPIVERLIDGGGVLVFDGPAVREVVTEW